MIEHHARRADHIPRRSREVFQWPEDSDEHRLIGKHLIQRTAIEALILNRTGRVPYGDKLIAVIDVVLCHHRQTASFDGRQIYDFAQPLSRHA